MSHSCVLGRAVRVVAILITLTILATSSWAQSGSSSIRGTVTDPQGSVIAGATVTLANPSTNFSRTQKSGPAGTFNFDLIQPGHYKMSIEAKGFKKTVVDVEALVNNITDLSKVALQIGASDESVTVTAESASVQVNTQDSSLGANFVSEEITQLPMESRDVTVLLTLQAGVTKDGSVAGARSDQSNITLDGVNINDAQTNSLNRGGATGGPVLRLNSEAIEEFRVSTVTASAGAGRSSGAQVGLVTKGGTNQFHGSVFEYHRNTIFEANNWFNKHADPIVPRTKLLRNTFGASFGGPIVKNKLFFFYSYEGRRDASSYSVSPRIVPLPSLAAGNIKFTTCQLPLPPSGTCTPGPQLSLTPAQLTTIFPDLATFGGSSVNPDSLTALTKGASYAANSNSVGDGLNTGGFIFNAPAPVQLNSHVARFDYNISDRQTVFVRMNVIHDHDASDPNNLQYFPDTAQPLLWSHPWGIAVAHTWTLSNTFVSNFRYGLTRQAFSQTGDTTGNYTFLRLVFYPTNGTYDSSRTTPVHNFVEDFSLVRGNHTWGFGGNITLVKNGSVNYSSAYDEAYTNPSGYKTNLIINSVNQFMKENYGVIVDGSSSSPVENAVTALLGRYTEYQANFTFNHDGTLLPSGAPKVRNFATQGYEGYIQDTWKMNSNLTLSYGLRYSLWRPAYEINGYEAQPNIPLGEFFARRVAGMNAGTPYNELISVNKSGPVNNGPPMYNWDKKVFLPRVAVAWSPKVQQGIFSKFLGKNGESVLRGGFAIANDYFGEQIATFFDERNTLGFASSQLVNVNTYNVGCGHYVVVGNGFSSCTSNPGPAFTGFGQTVRTLPGINAPTALAFPQQQDPVTYPTTIQSSLDSQLTTPKNYTWSATFERELWKNGLLQVSYLGRMGRHLLAQRDVMTPADLRDPKSGMDFYTAATILEKARQQGVDPSYFATHPIPYFENLFSPLIEDWGYTNATQAVYDDAYSFNKNDWTTTMLDIDGESTVGGPTNHAFYQPQYGALATWTTIGNSMYHGLAVSFRQRTTNLTLDFNYTYSHSLDDASGLQTEGGFSSSSLILNPFRQRDNYASSDFDMRHIINVSSVWQLPFGHGKALLSSSNTVVNGILGGWQLSNIFRWNSGIPLGAPYDANTWSTNWENQSQVSLVKPLSPTGCPSRPLDPAQAPKFFGNCFNSAFAAFRSSYPGETGLRNYFRFPGYVDLDFGLGKTWKMPYAEKHSLQFRWEVFNATNTQRFGDALDYSRTGWGIKAGSTSPAPNFSNFVQIQGTPRVMQFGLRYAF